MHRLVLSLLLPRNAPRLPQISRNPHTLVTHHTSHITTNGYPEYPARIGMVKIFPAQRLAIKRKGIIDGFLYSARNFSLSREEKTRVEVMSQKACFVCGKIGHLAESCESERLCYNCNQPGHVQSECTVPRTVEFKQCYNCGETGHVKTECSVQRCFNCSNAGHISRDCTEPKKPRFGATPRAPGKVSCYRCGGPNHKARDCLQPAAKCYACGKVGHISKECPSGSSEKTCYNCNGTGHISRDCPVN